MKNKYNKDIFDKNEYLNYIDNNKEISQCHLQNLINYYNKKFTFFADTNSNQQIKNFFKNALGENNVKEIAKIQLLLMHFIPFKLSNKVINEFKVNINLKDSEVIKYINKNTTKEKLESKFNPFDICNEWNFALQNISLNYINNIKNKSKKLNNLKYLDVGCGNGGKTKMLSNALKLEKENTYCTDIETWGPYKKNKDKIPFQFKYIVDGKLDYPDNTFDIVSCFLTLHHIPKMEDFIKEINRIIKPGGCLILVEHSIYTDYDRLLVNIQHMLYKVFYDLKKDYINNPDYIYCYNMYEWNYIMNKCKLENKKQDILPFEIQFEVKYDNIFYGFYQKKV